VKRMIGDQTSLTKYAGTHSYRLLPTAEENAVPMEYKADVFYDEKDWKNLRAVPAARR
jgi:hypothetical protein